MLDLIKEFHRQTNNLLQKKYPKLLGLSEEEFLKLLNPFKEKLSGFNLPEIDLEAGHLPFVLVVKTDPEKAMELVEYNSKAGFTKFFPHSSKDFQTIEEVNIPEGVGYLLLDIDRGKENINIPPSEALKMIKRQNRSPLTIVEGVSVITQFPEFLIKNNCLSLLASRNPKDKRVPAIWINSEKRANLGWCWDGNPHSWLGSASARKRV